VFLSRCTADNAARPVGQLMSRLYVLLSFQKPSNKLHPFATDMALGTYQLQTNRPSSHPGFTPHTVTSFHRSGLQQYYRIICHLGSLRSALSYLLSLPIHATSLTNRNNARLPRLRRTPCEQSHPQSHYGTDQVLGFVLFGTLTLL